MTGQQKAAAGWYAHPSMANTLRYWDGQKWTDQVAPAPAATTGVNYGRVFLAIVLGLLVAIGLLWMGLYVMTDTFE